jgi:plastocyanin
MTTDSSTRSVGAVSRRSFLRTAAGVTALGGTATVGTAQEGERHVVDMTDELVFDPDSLTVAPGDTVVWENVGAVGHSVTAYEDEIPEDATYFASGGFDTESAARNAYSPGDPESGDVVGGESYEHVFEIEGTYGYFCIPHEAVGMVAEIEVTPGGAADGGDGGPLVPEVPDSARALAIAASISLFSVLSLVYVFMKYGGDYGFGEE